MGSTSNHLGVLIAAGAWLLLAVLIGWSGLLASLPPASPQVVLFGLAAALLLLFGRSSVFRRWALAVDIRALVLVHASRFIGVYFLVLYSRGELPYAFAVPGGWGDIGVATTAVAVSVGAPRRGPVGWAAYFAWNALGLLDILAVVATAGRLGMAVPESMSALTRLPLSLLPTFLVPIIVVIHIVIFVRLLASLKANYLAF